MNTGTTSMQGVPTTVSVSSAFLQKCMNDPEKAKYLEENLAAIPDCAKSAVNGCLGTLTNLSYMIDANGNISVAQNATIEQRDAARMAMLSVIGQSEGQLIISADGEMPEVDIPVVVILLG